MAVKLGDSVSLKLIGWDEGLEEISKLEKMSPDRREMSGSTYEFPEPLQESAAACEDMEISPFRNGPN